MDELFDLLREQGIRYERIDHPPVYTCEEAERLVPGNAGVQTKNLFLRDRKGRRHFLVVTRADKQVDLKTLSDQVGSGRLGFASPERLARHLGVEPGGVSLFAIIRDTEHRVEIVVDRDLWEARAWRCHPLVNTATLVVERNGIVGFLDALGRSPRTIRVPAE